MMLKVYPLYLVFVVCSLATAQDFSFLNDLSTSVTGQTYLFVGDDLRLNCSLNDDLLQDFTAFNISFEYQFRAQGKVICVPQNNIKVVDINLAMLVIGNITLEYAGPYSCHVGSTYCQDGLNGADTLVGFSDDVSIEYSPQNVTNFECVVYNWDESMTCTWQHPVDYVIKSDIKVTIRYATNRQGSYVDCPGPSYNTCTWNQENLLYTDRYYVAVTITNTKNNATTTKVFEVNPSKLVKPAPVESLSFNVSETSPGCFLLSWTHLRKRRYKIYRIKHKDAMDENFNVLIDNINTTYYNACGYLPYTFHNFSVDCYPTHNDTGFWSDPVYTSAWTLMTAPDKGPQITNGSFRSTPCVGGSRTVTLMWQEVEKLSQNGVIDGYLIKLGETHLSNVTADNYSTDVDLPCTAASQLTLYAHNEGGYSLTPSILLIPPVTFSVPKDLQESFSVHVISSQYSSEHKDTLYALWDMGGRTDNISYTIFWCKGVTNNQRSSCTGQIYWMKVAGGQRSYAISMPSSEAGLYMYGISVTDTQVGMASDIFWTDCLFNRISDNVHWAVKNLKLESRVNEVQVSWSQIQCSYQTRIKVSNYTVKWCQATRCNEEGAVSHVAVPASEYMYTVSGLTAKVKYSFTVQPVSYEDVGDDIIPWKDAVPIPSEDPISLVDVLVGIFVPLVIILFAIYTYWRCRKSWYKAKNLKPIVLFQLKENTSPRVPDTFRPSVMAHAHFSTNAGVTLLSQVSTASSDSEWDNNVTTSPQRTPTSQQIKELCEMGQHDRRTVQEFASSSPESYQNFGYSPGSQTFENVDRHQESISSKSLDSYQRLTYPQSDRSADTHIGLQALTEETGTEEHTSVASVNFEEHTSVASVDFEEHYATKESSTVNTLGRVPTMTPATPTLLRHFSVASNAGMRAPGEIGETSYDFSDQPMSNVSNVSNSVLKANGSLPCISQDVGSSAGSSSSLYSPNDSQTSNCASSVSVGYMQINTFRQLSPNFDEHL